MIKLNNKNITYVALADSNNSLKTPKEIWYADSNNSVKLVYRRKDALIEGEDYEKYHWLNGDGSAYIDTLVKNLTNVHYIDLFISVDGVSSGHHIFFGRESVAPYYNSQVVLYYVSDRQNISVWANNVGHEINFADIVGNVTLNFDTNIASTPTDSVDFSISNYNSAFSIFLFASNNNGNAISPFIGKIKKLEIDNILHLIPCKLLKPVPKWLDANGIRRQVGECGMIDLISGKFYGNVNSVGTFTVENYYERKEWLKGDGEAFINTLINPSFGDKISAEGVITSRPNIDNIAFISANSGDDCFGLYTGGSYHKEGLPQYVILHTSSVRTEYIAFRPQEDGKFKMQCQLTRNSLPQYSLSIDNVDVQPYVINATINQVPTSSYRIGYFVAEGLSSSNIGLDTCKLSKVTINSHTLIPCTLTMDLPASMDANNIARTKGTSGMWDLVSDRFYGNVASSGTFKAVNLAEGVDYEVHQWLVGEINTQGTMMQFTIGKNFEFKRRMYRGLNTGYFYGNGYSYYTNTNYFTLVIWENSSSLNVFTLQPPTSGEDITIESTTSKLTQSSKN